MKNIFLCMLLFFGLLINLTSAQNIENNEITKLIIYEVILYDDSILSNHEHENNEHAMQIQSNQNNNYILNFSDQKKLIDHLSSINNFSNVVILNAKNQRVENKIEFEKCYLTYDTVHLEYPTTGNIEKKIIKNNYLNNSKLLKIKFYESWKFDLVNMKINKETLGYSIIVTIIKNGVEITDKLLFSIMSNKNSLDFLNQNGCFK